MNKHRIEQNKRRLFLPLALLYLFWIESGVIDPCSATPGYDDSGVIAWMSFPFVAGMLLYWCLHEYNITSTALQTKHTPMEQQTMTGSGLYIRKYPFLHTPAAVALCFGLLCLSAF